MADLDVAGEYNSLSAGIPPLNLGVRAKVMSVRFTPGKVLYDLAVEDSQSETGFYEALPLRDVDSFMCLDTE